MHKVILLMDFFEEFSKQLLTGITQYSKEHGSWVFCRMPLYYRESKGISGIVEWAREWKADGLIGQLYHDKDINLFQKSGIAVIAQDFKEPFDEIPNITGAYHETGELAASYFLSKGFQHFAFYGFKDIVWSRERAKGFENLLKSRGYQVRFFEHKETKSQEIWHYKLGLLAKWVKKLPKPTAVLCCDDNQAFQIIEVCRQINVRVPEEVAVLGVDNDKLICQLSDPPLSSIKLDAEKAGYNAAQLLDDLINKKTVGYDVIVKASQIITRQSTDIFATNDQYVLSTLKYIHKNYTEKIRVDKLVSLVPFSRRAFEIRFKQVTGLPVYQYIFNLRMEKFANMLLDTDKTVFEVALRTGFDDCKNLARQFKKAKGCTPVEYRKKHITIKSLH